MKKEEFLKTLRKKLDILDASEVDDIIEEYDGYITEKMENGATEIDAVASFGDIDELVSDLLKAYKINIKKQNDPIGDFSKKVINTINQIVDELNEKSSKEIIEFILEICVILFLIGICRIPVSMLIGLGKEVFYILSSPLNRIFYMIWKFVLEFAYIILSILVFARIFDKRYLKKKKEELVEEKKETYKKINKEENSKIKKEQKIEEHKKNGVSNLGEILIKICVFFLKFMAICFLFGASFYLIGMAFVLGICIYLLVQGVTYFGFYLVMLSLFLLGVIFFRILFNFVIDRKNKGISLFINIMISIVFLGVGCGLALLEVSETEFINSVPNDLKTEILTEELSMTKDTIFLGNVTNYNIDNNLNTIKIEYEYYPLGTKMSTDIKKREDLVYLDWNLERLHIKNDLLDHIINDLREKKVYNYYIEPTITITSNEENITHIKKNRQKYYKSEKNYSSCEFIRTFTIEMIRQSKKNNEMKVVVSQYLSDDLTTITLDKELIENLEVGASYEFTFKTYQAYIDTDIENIFLENEIVDIKKTDKIGIDQRQDNSCTIFY